MASRIANVACRLLFGLEVHDLNWIKAFRREVTDGLALRSQWHRYILVLAHHEGYRIGEVKVPYQAREAGRSKFGLGRLPVSAVDVVTLKILLTFQRKPSTSPRRCGSKQTPTRKRSPSSSSTRTEWRRFPTCCASGRRSG